MKNEEVIYCYLLVYHVSTLSAKVSSLEKRGPTNGQATEN